MNRKRLWAGISTVLWLIASTAAMATDALLPREADEARARMLFSQLKCEVCAGQSLAGSHAQLAIDMRNLIRGKIESGAGDADILAFFVERYGEDILMEPPVRSRTRALWLAPLLFVITGAIAMVWWLRRQQRHMSRP